MGFIKALLIILLIWYSIKLLARILLPIFIAKFIRNTQERFQQKYQGQQNKKDEDIKSNSSREKKNSTENLGEYVDFEEVED
tara:strand:- start:303 stop:548 length:246 start_codon:yes stop_codon:yes gene_type:complete